MSASETSTSRPKYCPECGGKIATNDKFCGGCGSPVEIAATRSQARPIEPPISAPFKEEQKRKVTSKLRLGGTAAFVVLVAFAWALFHANSRAAERAEYEAQFSSLNSNLDDMDAQLARFEKSDVLVYDSDLKLKIIFDLPSENLKLLFPDMATSQDALAGAVKELGHLPEDARSALARQGKSTLSADDLARCNNEFRSEKAAALQSFHGAMSTFRWNLNRLKSRLGVW